MSIAKRVRTSRAGLVGWMAFLTFCAGALLGPAQDLAAEEEWERTVERAKRQQERQMASAARQGKGMGDVVRRYKQRVATNDDALSHWLLGRAYWYSAKERIELRQRKGQQLTATDEKVVEGQTKLAVAEMNAALRKDSKFWYAYQALTIIEMSRGEMKAADGHVMNFRRLAPDNPEGIKLHVQLLLMRGKIQGCEGALLGLLKRDPKDHEARRLLLAVYAHTESWEKLLPHVDKLLVAMPQDPDLRLMKADALLGLERWIEAEKVLRPLARQAGKSPAELMILKRLVDAYSGKGDIPAVIATLRRMLQRVPKNWRIRTMLVEALMASQDWAGALSELDLVRKQIAVKAEDAEAKEQFEPMFRWQRAIALINLKRPEEALTELETLTGLRGDVLHVLDLIQQLLGQLERHKERLAVLKRMQPLVKDKKALAELEKFIAALEAALSGGGTVAPGGLETPAWGADRLSDLLERCIHPDPVVRRKALFEYYEADVPFVDAVVYRRYDPGVEPDEECRIWVVRILGKYQVGEADEDVVRDAARYVGLALEDPSRGVRKVAGEELGRIGAPAGILYLMPHLSLIKLQPLPEDEAARKDLEEEYNAARLSMSKLTGQPDTPIGAPTWVPIDEAARNREGWRLWLDKPEGIAARLRALEDLKTVTGIDPRWQLRYALQDLVRPAPDQIALETYRVLRDAIRRIGEEAIQADPWWKSFPMIEDAGVTDKALPDIRKRMRDWWGSLPREKNAAGESGAAAGDPASAPQKKK